MDTSHPSIKFTINAYVFIAEIETNSIICQIFIPSLNIHEVKVGKHDREILVLRNVNYHHHNSKNVTDMNVLLIIDFSQCPPTIQTV